jgi:hypothetical protein
LTPFDLAPVKSGGGPPHSKTLCATRRLLKYAKRLGLRQPSGALQENEGFAGLPLIVLCQ